VNRQFHGIKSRSSSLRESLPTELCFNYAHIAGLIFNNNTQVVVKLVESKILARILSLLTGCMVPLWPNGRHLLRYRATLMYGSTLTAGYSLKISISYIKLIKLLHSKKKVHGGRGTRTSNPSVPSQALFHCATLTCWLPRNKMWICICSCSNVLMKCLNVIFKMVPQVYFSPPICQFSIFVQ